MFLVKGERSFCLFKGEASKFSVCVHWIFKKKAFTCTVFEHSADVIRTLPVRFMEL